MTNTTGLDRVLMEYEFVSQRHAPFSAAYGERAAAFLEQLPWLFRLFRRVPFDEDLPLRARHAAAVVAFYLAEQQDFFSAGGGADSEIGLIDDVFAAYFGLREVVDIVGDPFVLRKHWRGETPLDEVIGLAHNIDVLREKLPSKVLEKIEPLLRMPK